METAEMAETAEWRIDRGRQGGRECPAEQLYSRPLALLAPFCICQLTTNLQSRTFTKDVSHRLQHNVIV